MSVPADTTSYVGIGAGYFDNYRGWETKNSVDELTISGLDMQVFMAAWSEHDSTQSDIYLVFDYIPMGDVNNNLPDKVFTLEQNYPNPFNPSTTISYSLSQSELVQLKVYDILGREVATLVNAVKSPGIYHVEFDAKNLASGIYYYQMKSGSFIQTKKMIFMK